MPIVSGKLSHEMTKNQIMKDENCQFVFEHIKEDEMEEQLVTINSDKTCEGDHIN